MATAGANIFENNSLFGNLEFPDLELRLENILQKIQTKKDLEKLISAITPLMKADRFNSLEQQKIKRIRQRAYDKRRNPRFLELIKSPDLATTPKPSSKPSRPKPAPVKVKTRKKISLKDEQVNEEIIIEKPVAQEKINSFSLGAMRAINKIDAEHLVSNTPRFLAWFLASSTTAYFIWQQSISLYQSAGFNNYAITATGGLLLVIGSSAYFSITRSFLALLLCLYASGYEGYLMISGTINNETQAQAQSVINNPELIFLKEKADKEMAEYKRQEARYNNPATDVFENGWFKKNYVTPAWEASAKAHSDYTAKKASLIARASDSHVTWLKIFYRLGLVFLCMLFVHRFFAILTPARKK